MDFAPQSEIEKQRTVWWAEHFKPGMTFAETARLNEQVFTLFPITEQERWEKTERLKNTPEFVL
jgi:hypothetical protein